MAGCPQGRPAENSIFGLIFVSEKGTRIAHKRFLFSQTIRAPLGYAGKNPGGHPTKKIVFPELRDIPNAFGHHPFTWTSPRKDIRTKSLSWCSFFLPDSCQKHVTASGLATEPRITPAGKYSNNSSYNIIYVTESGHRPRENSQITFGVLLCPTF